MIKPKLVLPVKDVWVTQAFGMNYLDFYQKMGLDGHQGIDFWTKRGAPLYAMHNGMIRRAQVYKNDVGKDGPGIGIMNWNIGGKFKTFSYHLLEMYVKVGETVKAGQLIGACDNSGKWTTGDHLHQEFMWTDENGVRLNKDNGYNGCINFSDFLPKNWEEFPVWSGYGQVKTGWGGRKWKQEVAGKYALKKQIGRTPYYLEIMAYVYGGWSAEDIRNTNMRYAWMYRRKKDFLQGDELTIPVKYSIDF